MPAWPRRLLFPCAIAIVIAFMIWQYKASPANAYPVESSFRNEEIELRIRKDDPLAVHPMSETTFLIQVNDPQGLPVNDADIRLTIRMPRMFCGEFRANVVFMGDGLYEAKVTPVMSGRWDAEAIVDSGGSSYSIKHRFIVED